MIRELRGTLTISGMDFHTKDREVSRYLNWFRMKVTNPLPKCDIYKSGPWKGVLNGVRVYQVSLEGSTSPNGSYHLIGGEKVRISYIRSPNTCGRCMKTANKCPGKSNAKKCNEAQGPMVLVSQHTKKMIKSHKRAITMRQVEIASREDPSTELRDIR